MSESRQNVSESPEPGRVSRRTLAAGVAWAVPAVAVASAAPAQAASVTTTTTTVAPCIAMVTNDSINWNVDNVAYQGCSSCRSHRDVRVTFHVTACETPVTIRVSNIVNASMWCAWTNTVGTLTKTVPANVNASRTFPATGDSISGGGNCTITAYESANDGMHINPCSSGPYFKYEIWYASTTTGSPAVTGYWGDTTTVPLPPGCGSTTTTTTTTCTAPANPTNLRQVGRTSNSFTLGWNASAGATSYEVRRCNSQGNSSSCTNWTGVGTATQYQFTGLNRDTDYRFYVRAKNACGTSSETYLTAGTSRSGAAAEGEAQGDLEGNAQRSSANPEVSSTKSPEAAPATTADSSPSTTPEARASSAAADSTIVQES